MKKFFKGLLLIAVFAALIWLGYKLIFGDWLQPTAAVSSDGYPYANGFDTDHDPFADTDPYGSDIPHTDPEPYEYKLSHDALSGTTFYYDQLNDMEKYFYTVMFRAVIDGDKSVTVTNLPEDYYGVTICRADLALRFDHTEFFWLHGFDYGEYRNGQITINLCNEEFWDYLYNPQDYIKQLENKVTEIVNMTSDIDDDYEKAKFLYKYIIDNTEYDFERLRENQKTIHSPFTDLIYTSYGCLVEGKAVCAGYSNAYKLLCDACGVECCIVTGKVNDAGHEWNAVKLDGEYYFVDPTWGDSHILTYDAVDYRYFCLSENAIGNTHSFAESVLAHPVCSSDRYDYCTYNGYIVSDYSDELVSLIINNQIGEKPVMFKCTNDKAFYETLDALEEKKISALSYRTFSYATVKYQDIILIYVLIEDED